MKKFLPGDLVRIISTTGERIKEIPPALVLSSSFGNSRGIDRNIEEIYTILYKGSIDTGVSSEWLELVKRS
jgi:hypothetical protein